MRNCALCPLDRGLFCCEKGEIQMIYNPEDILILHPIRKTAGQKEAFCQSVQNYVSRMGYSCTVETGAFHSRNLIIGDPKTARFLVTAHYDTCAGMPVPNYITPCNFWGFLAYQLLLVFGILGVAFLAGTSVAVLLGDVSLGAVIGYLFVLGILALMILGPANTSNVNDNSSGVITLLEIARTIPENQRHKVCFVLFDLEEAGLIGSASYRRKHKNETDRQLILNLDCVGEGDHLMMFPTKYLKKDRKKLTSLYKACGYWGKKSLLVREKGFAIYPSDQMNFPYGVGICALSQGKYGLYLGKIHTKKDTVLDGSNINILRAALTSYICCDAVE